MLHVVMLAVVAKLSRMGRPVRPCSIVGLLDLVQLYRRLVCILPCLSLAARQGSTNLYLLFHLHQMHMRLLL